VLVPPVRAARTALTNFQLLATQAFAGSVSGALLDSAVVDSAAVDHTYLAVQRLLSLPVNAGLARLEAAYTNSRTGLATILATGTRSADSAKAAAAEETADKNLDNEFGSLQQTSPTTRSSPPIRQKPTPVTRGTACWRASGSASHSGSRQPPSFPGRRWVWSAMLRAATRSKPGQRVATNLKVKCNGRWRWPKLKSRSSNW